MLKSFASLGLSTQLQEHLLKLKITTPTPVQEQVIPIILNKKEDLVAIAQTGTGKTAAFSLPILQSINIEKLATQAIILTPTRELAQQIYSNLENFSNTSISKVLLSGGTPLKQQIEQLKLGAHIIVATPGRLIDLLQRQDVNVNQIDYLVLDEADEMITSHHESINVIIKALPKHRRTLLFTATLSGKVKQLVQNYMSKHTIHVNVNVAGKGHKDIDHQYVVVEPIEKLNVLMHFLSAKAGKRGIIFCKTKAAVNKLAKNLAINKFSSGAIHGSLTQGIRDRIMEQFRAGYIDILVATDLAARGIDVKNLEYVINYHLPDTYDAYVHRSGRTARAGAKGLALSIIQQDEVDDIPEFEQELDLSFSLLKKADAKSIELNNALLWARKVFKTKPNKNLPQDFKAQIKTIFHHLTKEELVDKVLANYVIENSITLDNTTKVKKKKKK